MKLKDIADKIKCPFIGNGDLEILKISTLEEASASDLTFLSNPKYRQFLNTTKAAAVILSDPLLLPSGLSGIISPNPYLSFAKALRIFHPALNSNAGIHSTAVISPSSLLGKQVSIGPFSIIEDDVVIGDRTQIGPHCIIYKGAKIGANSKIYSHCIVREFCQIGNNVILQDNAVIGSDGFGYAPDENQSWLKIPQTGIVIIEDEVEVGAGVAIDRGTISNTIIRSGVKIDNLVHLGHACIIGSNTLLCAQVGLAGSTTVGNNVILSGQVGAAGHLTIGDRVIAIAQTGIASSVESDQIISGSPAITKSNWLKSSAIFAQLPQLVRELRELKKQVKIIMNKE